ncbi:MAG: dihydroorotate dehydrogenase electron transfer subunit [Clostridiales bacterium]|nr:dihydroorotate dehydrogenase electron transfer subunit [Clostridiales bacterium]
MSMCGCSAQGASPSLENVRVVSNDRIAEGVGLLIFEAPRTAHHVAPGQFVHVRIARGTDFILRRPFSVYRAHGDHLEILYQVVGRGTREMAHALPGTQMDLIGPLGCGWRISETIAHALLVSGGLGAAPLGMLAEELARRGVAVTVAMGAPCGERLVGRDLFERVARRVEIATDDGSCGAPGLVTGVCRDLICAGGFDAIYTCGPEPMQRIVASLAAEAGVSCQVSLERLMACGIGACLSCVVDTRCGLSRVCVDGPVFYATDVVWETANSDEGPSGAHGRGGNGGER